MQGTHGLETFNFLVAQLQIVSYFFSLVVSGMELFELSARGNNYGHRPTDSPIQGMVNESVVRFRFLDSASFSGRNPNARHVNCKYKLNIRVVVYCKFAIILHFHLNFFFWHITFHITV